MTQPGDLPPVRGRGEAAGRALAAAAGAVCVLAAVLPWVQAPIGFERLRETGLQRPEGVGVLVYGVLLLVVSYAAVRRPGRRFHVRRHAVAGVAIALATAQSWSRVDRVLRTEVPGVGVHPGTHGAGPRLAAVAAALLLAAAAWVERARRAQVDSYPRNPYQPDPG